MLPRCSTIGALSLRAKTLSVWRPASQRGNLIAIREAFFVQLTDAVSHLCKVLHKLVEKSLQPRLDAGTILSDILIMSPSVLVRLAVISVRFHGVLILCRRKPPCACTELWESIFPCESGFSDSVIL